MTDGRREDCHFIVCDVLMQMSKAAYGTMNHGDSVTSTAKYSDTVINGLAKGQCAHLKRLKPRVDLA